jgi:hypothetical protein
MTKVVIVTSNWTSWPGFAGATWVPIQYLIGLMRLGVEATWVDLLGSVNPRRDPHSVEYLMARIEATAHDFGFHGRWCVIYDSGARYFGLSAAELESRTADADLLLRVSGRGLPEDSPLLRIPRRAYVDVDPGFSQIWAHEVDMGFEQYDCLFTVGLNVGGPGFSIPMQGRQWHPTLPPVVLDLWPPNIDETCERFTTIGDWWGNQHTRFQGEYYGTKREEFLRFVRVPLSARQPIEAALAIYPGDHAELGRLHASGWLVRDPYLWAGDPRAYGEFIRYSRAEFSVAKSGYVRSKSGWVSDRSVCYLASGKPVLVQSTGIEPYLPTGMGLLTFRTPAEAVARIRAVNADYLAHAHAARQLAEDLFDSDRVLGSLLQRALP